MILAKRILVMLIFTSLPAAVNALSLKDVHHQVSAIAWHVSAIRAHNKLAQSTRTISVQVGKTPLHAYIKTLELLEKIQKYQKEQGLTVVEMPALPVKKVRSKHLMAVVKVALKEVTSISESLNLTITPEKLSDKSKTASDLYGAIWLVSMSMDALVAPIDLADVQRNTDKIALGLQKIAKRLDKPLSSSEVTNVAGKHTADVTISLYKLLYKIAELQRKLKVNPLVVPNFPTGDILPSHAYEASGSVITDLTRLSLKLKIRSTEQDKAPLPVHASVSVDSLYAQLAQLNQSADLLAK